MLEVAVVVDLLKRLELEGLVGVELEVQLGQVLMEHLIRAEEAVDQKTLMKGTLAETAAQV